MAKDATVLAVYEDWAGGAGNALGTLYAYQKATALAESKGYDLAGKMRTGKVCTCVSRGCFCGLSLCCVWLQGWCKAVGAGGLRRVLRRGGRSWH